MARRLQAGEAVRMIYRCRWCEKAGRPGFVRAIDYAVSKYGNLYSPEDLSHYTQDDYRCPTCGHECKAAMVDAHYVPDQKCGGKCVNAIGPSCECSCGGKNHGAGYTFHIVAK